jgi:hypothetical protein
MLPCVALVRTDISEEPSASTIKMTRIDDFGKTLEVSSNLRTLRKKDYALMMEAPRFSEMSDFTRATRRNIPEDDIIHSHCG